MKKVKLTQEQAYVIESKTLDELGEWFYGTIDPNDYMFELFQDFCIEKLARAKLIGYEVGPKFKVGDWVVHKYKGEIGKVVEVSDLNTSIEYYSDSHSKFRHATEEEIKEEKERRWWAAHGRDVWELKEGDVLQEPYNDIEEVESIHPNGNYIVLGTWDDTRESSVEIQKESGSRIVCFAEDRKDLEEDSNA